MWNTLVYYESLVSGSDDFIRLYDSRKSWFSTAFCDYQIIEVSLKNAGSVTLVWRPVSKKIFFMELYIWFVCHR